MTAHCDVELVCDGGPGLGYGHIRRTRTLADALRASGLTARLSALSPAAHALLPAQHQTRTRASVVVFDSPAGVEERMEQARAAGQCVVCLDWFGSTEPDINIVVYPHGQVRARVRSYVGLEYVLVRDDIATLADQGDGAGVVVVLGGGDVLAQGHGAAVELARLGLDVTLVQGPLANESTGGESYRVLVDPPDFAELMCGCAWAVTNGGGCMFEAFCASKAVVALPQTDAERRIAALAARHGALLGIGTGSLRPFEPDETRAVGVRARQLVDGRGAERIVSIIQGLL